MTSNRIEAPEKTWHDEGVELPVRRPIAVAGDDSSDQSTGPSDAQRIPFAEKRTSADDVSHERQVPSALPLRAMLEINKLKDEYGNFSYYLLRNTKLVIHAEDKQQDHDLDSLKMDVTQTLLKYPSPVEVVAIPESFKASHCGIGIGEAVVVNAQFQTVGLYLQYNEKTYFVTAGHCLPAKKAAADAAAVAEEDGDIVQMFPESDLPGVVSSTNRQGVEVFFCSFDYNSLPNTSGQLLMNYVDIMICEKALLLSELSVPPTSWNTALHRCKTCVERSCSHNRDAAYAAKRIMYFNDVEIMRDTRGTPLVLHCAEHLVIDKRQLMCYPCRQEFIVGEVIGYRNCLSIEANECLSNVLLIRPLGRAGPIRGDSGSVWVTKDTGEAVAITCGMGEASDDDRVTSVWLAALLHPCLEAFCEMHKKRFKSPTDFRVIA